MVTRASSPLAGHATPTKAQKPRTRTVAHRRVYGKRRADAPKAVFEQPSPARLPENVEALEAIQKKLADVTIAEQPAPRHKEPENQPSDPKPEGTEVQTASPSSKPSSASPTQSLADTSVESPSQTTTPKKPAKYETMVAVRIPANRAPKSVQASPKKDDTPSTDKRKKNFFRRRSSGVVHNTAVNTYARPILNEALSAAAAQSVQKFSTWASRSAKMFDVAKLAEGSYGEVYKLHLRDEACRPAASKSKLAKLRAYGDGVFKVVPLRAQSGPGSKKFTTIEEIVSEIKMLKYLDPIPGFARFREIHVVQGRFPDTFQGAWDHYKKTSNDCLNPNPSSKKAYPDSQLWAIVEMDDAGCELEKFCWSSVFQIYDIFWGVAMALARAEEYALFEHRDLHLGNVCIRSTRPDDCMDPPSDLDIIRQQSASGFGFSSLETTIIDYSLSRADLQLADSGENTTEVTSSDLDRKQIFDSIGQDEDEILLRNTYRYMRATLYTGNPLETEKAPNIPGIWSEYAPRTNLVWLLFLLKNLLKNRKPEASQPPPQPARKALAPCSPNRSPMNKSGKNEKNKAKESNMADIRVKERQTKDIQNRIGRLKQTLEGRLKSILELLDLEHGHEDMCCAADLVAYAMDQQWLEDKDFF
ncbi:hypothetical protein N7474_001268 [Penicillium riverlandense]|uniref:uncharacterized protein n=1 Tax=Penicillium riverlandense TaxID=1903569 RepID=UPI002547FF38|nr:uncharacterized protein N7474_001268 [Penicillium riverlandense]KAJ5832957.1 hypothetical protein N7474_001268 [Penicillium riverlandense]